MRDGPLGLLEGAALDGEHDVAFGLAANLDHSGPVYDAVAAGAADRRAGDLTALGAALLDGNVLRVEVYEPVCHAGQPLEGILAAEVGVARVEIDADGRTLDE